jgi:hypothetical protein
MAYNTPVLSLTLPAAVINGIAQSQSKGSAGNFTLNGSLVSGGVANLVVARRVLLTFAGDETGHNFLITGTDRYGRAQSETVAGTTAGSTYTTHDFLTVTVAHVDAATTSTVQIGTNAVGSTAPYITDTFINPGDYGAAMHFSGTVTASVEVSYDDFSPLWDLANNSPTWYIDPNFNGLTADARATITGPVTMIRQTNSSGTGTATTRLIVPFIGGA